MVLGMVSFYSKFFTIAIDAFPIMFLSRFVVTTAGDQNGLSFFSKVVLFSSANRTYDELTRHRREMALARIGNTFSGI